MKEYIIKHKEGLIAFLIVILTISILSINFYKVLNKTIKISESSPNINANKNVNENDRKYYIEDGKLFVTFDFKEYIEVPGNFEEMKEYYKEETYQISNEKTVFYYKSKGKNYIVFSNNEGMDWQTIELNKNGDIKYLQFINENCGFIFEMVDVAMTQANFTILKTVDGGLNWNIMNQEINGNIESNIRFITDEIGFLINPKNGGDSCELYRTENSGNSFSKITVDEIGLDDTNLKWNEIYDYYNLPEKEEGYIIFMLGQGADGDYNGNDKIKYISKDNGLNWKIKDNGNIHSKNNCKYKSFKPAVEQGYDYTQDMEYKDKIYHKIITSYEEYTKYKARWLDILDMSKKDFDDKFMIITAIENTSMLGLTVSNIYAENDNTYIELGNYPDYIEYDKNNTCISIILPNDMKKTNISIIDGRNKKQSIKENNNWVNESTEGLNEISLEQAITIAKQYAKGLVNSNSYMGKYLSDYTKVYDIKRTIIKPNNYWEITDGIIERKLEMADFERTAYEVTLVRNNDELEIERAIFYVDMYTGKVIGGKELSD